MANNVTFHRTSKKQDLIKQALIKAEIVTAEDVEKYNGVELGDDDTIRVVSDLDAFDELVNGENCTGLAKVTTYAIFSGKVISVGSEIRATITRPYHD